MTFVKNKIYEASNVTDRDNITTMTEGDQCYVLDIDGNGNAGLCGYYNGSWVKMIQQGAWGNGQTQEIASSDNQTVSLGGMGFGFITLDMTDAGGSASLTLTDPTNGGLYILGFTGVGIGTTITFPSSVKNLLGVALSAELMTLNTVKQLVYNGTDYIQINQYTL